MKKAFLKAQRDFSLTALVRLVLLAVILGGLWYWGAAGNLTKDELALWNKVRSAQRYLYGWRESRGLQPEEGTDPWRTGFIGVEWSAITTTLGPPEAKRTSADPLWAVFLLRQFREMGIGPGDPVAVLSSSSFPGLVYSLMAAVEHLGASVLWIHSLGSSTWGANNPSLPWPVIARALREGGFLLKKPDWYTLGGEGETGGGLPQEGLVILQGQGAKDEVPFLTGEDLSQIIEAKVRLVRAFAPKVAVSVGGGAALFAGNDEEFLTGGFFPGAPLGKVPPGEGVLQGILKEGIPVLHLLNMRKMASDGAIPFDGPPAPRFLSPGSGVFSLAGLAFFFYFLHFHRRWDRWEG